MLIFEYSKSSMTGTLIEDTLNSKVYMIIEFGDFCTEKEESGEEENGDTALWKEMVYILDKGPQDYEIIQRNEKNCADVCLEGHYVLLGHEGKVRVFVRILEENSGGEIRTLHRVRCRWKSVVH